MPAFLLPVRTRAGNLFNIDPNSLIQTSIIEYSPGSPIGWHPHIPYFGVVVGISFGAACRMRFRNYNRAPSKTLNRDEILSWNYNRARFILMSGGFTRDLAAFNSAGKGDSLLDHDEDFAREAVRGFETETLILQTRQPLLSRGRGYVRPIRYRFGSIGS
jgi:hypothetical protein